MHFHLFILFFSVLSVIGFLIIEIFENRKRKRLAARLQKQIKTEAGHELAAIQRLSESYRRQPTLE